MDGTRIAFLYATAGSGHEHCARALKECLNAYPQAGVNAFSKELSADIFPFFGPLVAQFYLELIGRAPGIWNYVYDDPWVETIVQKFQNIIHSLNQEKICRALNIWNANAFVCTHALACGLISRQKRKIKSDWPLVAVITDFDVHRYWIYPEVDLYITANISSKTRLIRAGIPNDKIKVLGIPTYADFSLRAMSKDQSRRALNFLPDAPTVLIMGGSSGLGPIAEITKQLISKCRQIQVIAIAGRNNSLAQELLRINHPRLRVYDYTSNISSLMDAADLLITKPGGVSCAEALAKRLPLVLLNPIPGQEDRNAAYLKDEGAALMVRNPREISKIIDELLRRPELLEPLSQAAKRIAQPHAAQNAVTQIIGLVKGDADYRSQLKIEPSKFLIR